MDADLEDPPEVIPQLIEQFESGKDVVTANKALLAEHGAEPPSGAELDERFSADQSGPAGIETRDRSASDLHEPEIAIFVTSAAAILPLAAAPLGIRKMDAGEESITLQFIPNPPIDALKIIQLI